MSGLTDDEFLHAFLESRLTPTDFDHVGHVRAAWLLLRSRPLEEAVDLICAGIARLAAQFGAPEKFNRTLSEAWARLLAYRLDGTLDWPAWKEANMDVLRSPSTLLSKHYSDGRLHSTEAKHHLFHPIENRCRHANRNHSTADAGSPGTTNRPRALIVIAL